MSVQITQGNFGITFKINITDANGVPLSLYDSTVSADIVFPDKTKVNYQLQINDIANGVAKLEIISAMTSQLGIHTCYIDVVTPVSRITLDNPIKYSVKPNDGGY